MGSPAGEKGRQGNEEQVAVTLTKPFWIGKTEVTRGQWIQVMGTEPWQGEEYVHADKDYPATFVSVHDTARFCGKLTDLERKAGMLKDSEEYRLPTEAEWEYACRAGTTTAYSFGDDAKELGEYAWFVGNTSGEPYANRVGLKKPNPWGLYDMHGKVWELCSDWYGDKLPGGADPVGPQEGSYRVERSGSCGRDSNHCRSASRFPATSIRALCMGFRVARSQSAQ